MEKVELISLHIPKTAGTSFRHFLKGIYGEKAVIRLDIPILSPILRINEKKMPEGAPIPDGTAVVHGHFNLEELRNRFPELSKTPAITWLRHPVERVVSNYYYLAKILAQELDEESKDLNILSKMQRSLLEYARDEINRNRQTKFLAGTPLEDFDFVGIQEFYDAEVAAMVKHFGWPPQPAPKLNVTGGKKREIDPEVFAEIAALNAEDMALYEAGLALRQQRTAKPKLELVSIHIPKTGGTSFYQTLIDNYGAAVSSSLRRVDVLRAQERYGSVEAGLDGTVRVLHGHFYYGELGLSPKLITWLRHPVDRVISNYRFFKTGLEHPQRNPDNYAKNKHRKNESLLTYAGRSENQNVMQKFLAGADLEDFFFIGFLERYQEDLEILGDMLGWSVTDAADLNKSKARDPVSEDIRNQIAKWNAADLALYQQAREIRGL